MGLELKLFGPPQVLLEGQAVALPTRKLLAVLAYLAIEGPTSRGRLAELLWEADEERAKGNLRGELYRLRKGKLTDALTDASGQLSLRAFASDLERFSQLVEQGLIAQALDLRRGLLLENLEVPDAPRFEEWLQLVRERWEERYNTVLLGYAGGLEQQGALGEALEAYQQLLQRDPLREEAVRGSMGLLAHQGEAAKALEHYRRHAVFLEKELGLAPTKETRALAEAIRVGHAITPLSQSLQSIYLAGRSSEWQLLEQSWQSGKAIFISGEAGVGKTRLLLDFSSSKGLQPALLMGRPGDAQVPFASITRLLRRVLEGRGEVVGWVRRELSRLLPELGQEVAALQGEEDRLRLFDGVVELLKQDTQTLLGSDDLQFLDGASLEVLDYLMSTLECPMLVAYRKGELSPRAEALVQNQIAAGRGVLLELEPLQAQAMGEMLSGLPLGPSVQHLAEPLHRLTGGNPLFVLEALKSLSEEGKLELSAEAFEQTWKNLPGLQKAQGLIAQRLGRLSQPGRDLLRLAAISGQFFNLRLAGKIIGGSPLVLAETSDELENAGILRGGRFAHDLLLETALASIPPSTRKLLHGEVLKALQGTMVPAAVLAQHALGSDDPQATVHYCLEAAKEARQLAAWPEALEQLGSALQALQQLPSDSGLEARIRLEREEVFYQTASRAAQGRELDLLSHLVVDAPGLASELAYRKGRMADTSGAFEEAAHWYRQSQTQAAKLALVYVLENLGTIEGAREAALEVFQHPDTPDTAFRAAILLAELGFEHGDNAAALEWFNQAQGLIAQQPLRLVRFARSKARFFYHSGDIQASIEEAQRGIALAGELKLPSDEASLKHNLAVALNTAHRVAEALSAFGESEAVARRLKMAFLEQSAQTQQGVLYIHLGEFDKAVQLVSGDGAYYKMVRALAQVHQGDLTRARANAQEAVSEFKAHIWQEREALYVLALLETRSGNHAQSEQILRQTLAVAEPTNLELCQSLLAFNLLVQGQLEEALEVSTLAYARYPHIASDLPVEQVAWVQAQILYRMGRTAEAKKALAQARAVTSEFLRQLDAQQQAVYLEAFAYNRAIVKALQGGWPESPVLL
jgi:DNA-binding SARP family transcriptional activator